MFSQLSEQQIKNLIAFSKTLGYVQYFHPADEAKLEVWDNVAINGSKMMLDVNDDEELLQTLKEIFLPLAPSVQFSSNRKSLRFDRESMHPSNEKGLFPVFWQHLGFELYSGMKRPYHSIRVNRNSLVEQRNHLAVDLTGKYDVKRYRGLPFEFRIEAELTDSTFSLPLSLGISGGLSSNDDFVLDEIGRKDYVFTGKVGDSTEHLIFKLNTNLNIPVSVDKPEFIVIDNGQRVKPVEINDGAANSKFDVVTIEVKSTALPLFSETLNFREHIKAELVDGIHFLMPLVVLGNESKTFPDANELIGLQSTSATETLNKQYYGSSAFSFTEVRLANVIILWNILRHSFPYWDDVKVPAERILKSSLVDAARPQSPEEFLQTIKKMTSYYNDSHMFVEAEGINDSLYVPPISLIKIKDKIVVKDVLNETAPKNILPGDIIEEVNGMPIKNLLDSLIRYQSGSIQMKTLLTQNTLLATNTKDEITLKTRRGEVEDRIIMKRDEPLTFLVPGNSGYLKRDNGWLDSSVYYFDLTRNTLNAEAFEELKKASNIIFDLRGYPFDQTISEDLIKAIISKKLEVTRIFTPKILYPDYKKITYLPHMESYEPSPSNQLPGNFIFLADASAQSAAESILGLVKDFNLGTIVGTPTSGTNGDVNIAYLPGKLTVYFTGLVVKTPNGKKHHLNGIKPDVYAEQSVESVRKRRDQVLQKALSLIH